MRKFYMIMLAVLCIASTAMAKSSATDGKTPKALNLDVKKVHQLRDAKSVVKKETITNFAKVKKATSTKAIEKLSGKKVLGMRKADGETSIEGTWTFALGDYFFDTSVLGTIYVDFEATLTKDGYIMFIDPTYYELPFIAEYDETTGVLIFDFMILGTVELTSGGSCYFSQEPFVINWDSEDFDYQPIEAVYDASTGTISFEEYNGIIWSGYDDEFGVEYLGDFSGYFLEGAAMETPEDPGNWEDLGEATLEDPWVVTAFGINQHDAENQWTVPLQRNVDNPNIYRLVDPYHKGPAAVYNASNKIGYITFDVTDPNHVVFLSTDAGFAQSQLEISKFYCMNDLGFFIAYYGFSADEIIGLMGDEMPYTTFKDGVIKLDYIIDEEGEPWYDANFGIQGAPEGGYAWQDKEGNSVDMTGSITFPGGTGINSIKTVKEAGSNAWYTISGVRVAQPTEKGLYIHNGKKVLVK